MNSRVRRSGARKVLTALMLLFGTPAVGTTMALAQECAAPCLQEYGRVEWDGIHLYWYSECTTTWIEGQKLYICIYKQVW
jgi:hypothetical protein